MGNGDDDYRSQLPAPPDHILYHSGGEEMAARRTEVWYTILEAWYKGQKPCWCGHRLRDDACLCIWTNLGIWNSKGTKVYWGVAIIINGEGTTTLYDLEKDVNPDGSPRKKGLTDFIERDVEDLPSPWEIFGQ